MVDGKEVTMQVKEGQKVIYSKYSGTEVKLEGEEYIIVRQGLGEHPFSPKIQPGGGGQQQQTREKPPGTGSRERLVELLAEIMHGQFIGYSGVARYAANEAADDDDHGEGNIDTSG
jgi:hypothetical protein